MENCYGCLDENFCKANNISPDENFECYFAEELCPICRLPINNHCQCINHKGGWTADKQRVALEHLYFFNQRQIDHIIWLENSWKLSYKDEIKQNILTELKRTW